MSGLVGDWQKLHRFASGLEAVGGAGRAGFPRLVRLTGRAAFEALREDFSNSHDASGSTWPRTTDGRAALVGFGKYWRLIIAGNAVRLSSNHPGARAHQLGATIVPTGAAGLLAFTIGGRKVFARKVKLPARRATPRNGGLDAWAPRLRKVVVDDLAAAIGVRS